MLIKKLDIAFEIFLCLLVFGITFSNAVVETCIGFIILIFLLKRFIRKDPSLPGNPATLLVFIFAAVIFVSFFRSQHFEQSFKGVLRILKYGFLYFASVDFLSKDEKRLKRFFWALISVALFTFLNALFQGISGFDLLRHKELIHDESLRRLSASFVHPNDFAAYIIMVLPLFLIFLCKDIAQRSRVLLFLGCLLAFYCLARTSSRGAWLGSLAGLFVFSFYYKKKLAVFIPAAVVLFVLLTPYGLHRITDIFSFRQNTVWERLQLWQGAWNMVKVHPVLGFGINTFSEYFPHYKPASYANLSYAHNSYLQMWAEIGIIGLSVFLCLVFTVLYPVFRGLKKKMASGFYGLLLLACASGYISFLFHSGLDTNLYSLALITFFWLMTAALTALNLYLEKKSGG